MEIGFCHFESLPFAFLPASQPVVEAATIAHSIKEAAGIIGGDRLYRIAVEFETLAKEAEYEKVLSRWDEYVSQ